MSRRPSSFFPPPFRIPDEPSPTKRQRCAPAPRQPRASSSATPDTSNVEREASTSRQARASSSATPDDFNAEREASAMRMFDVWSQLAEKYSTRIGSSPSYEDDIVDLVTGEIVKDRGVLRAGTWKFPRVAEDSVDDRAGVGTDDEDDDEDIDDVDELDAFVDARDVLTHGWTVPPVRSRDPADAKDLQEFMEAERKRREECGDEEESEDDDGDPGSAEEAADAPLQPSVLEDSDDELGNWDIVDESNIVCPVGMSVENPETIEILDTPSVSPARCLPPNTTPKCDTPPPKTIPNRRPPQFQLYTPPLSRTPSILSSTDDFDPFTAPPTDARFSNHAVSQVGTRSQSRGSSPLPQKDIIQESHPRLNLADVVRGRSAYKRPVCAKSIENLGRPKASSSSTVGRPRSQSKIGAEMSPPSRPLFKSGDSSLSGSTELTPQRIRKRKRKSLSVDNEDSSLPDFATDGIRSPARRRKSTDVDNPDFPSSSPVKVKPKPRPSSSANLHSKRTVEAESDSESESDTESSSHRPRMSSAVPAYYPTPSLYPYPPYPPAADGHPAIPLQDHAQFIISQAMHQLSTLFTTPWPVRPFTPPRHSSSASSASGSSPFPYPTTPHHQHPYVYPFSSGASTGTLPPSSPPVSPPSSSPTRNQRASLVPRSRSRGRRVSFKVEDQRNVDVDTQDTPASGRHSHPKKHEELDDSGPSLMRKDKGKEKILVRNGSNTSLKSKRKQ
ncbi:hypothetical protein C8R47DRAFT_1207100 [Mycena vitilis]|nr:hypothetical protein C8R47DRAFT_1207100 [Mycena vitilis]